MAGAEERKTRDSAGGGRRATMRTALVTGVGTDRDTRGIGEARNVLGHATRKEHGTFGRGASRGRRGCGGLKLGERRKRRGDQRNDEGRKLWVSH